MGLGWIPARSLLTSSKEQFLGSGEVAGVCAGVAGVGGRMSGGSLDLEGGVPGLPGEVGGGGCGGGCIGAAAVTVQAGGLPAAAATSGEWPPL